MFTTRRLLGYILIGSAVAYGVLSALLAVFSNDRGGLLLSHEFGVPFWTAYAALFVGFCVGSFMEIEANQHTILKREYHGVEIFRDADALLERLADVSVGAETICTLNFSPPMGASGALDKYFTCVHSYLSDRRNRLRSFRSIASVESPEKARWIAQRASMFIGNQRVSLACFKEENALRLMCYHVVLTNRDGYVFWYPPVAVTGVMSACLIINRDIARVLEEQFEKAWERSEVVLAGGAVAKQGIEFLAERGAHIDSAELSALKEKAVTI